MEIPSKLYQLISSKQQYQQRCPKTNKGMGILILILLSPVKDPSLAAFAGLGSYAAAENPHALTAYLAAFVAS